MTGRVLGRRLVIERAMRSPLVVVPPPAGDDGPRRRQIFEPVVVQAFVSEPAVEALDVGVLRRLPGRDQLQLDTMSVGPLVEGSPGELRPLIGPNRARTTSEDDGLIEHTGHVLARDAVVDDDVDGLLGEVVDDRQAFQTSTVVESVHHEVHRPDLIRPGREEQRLAFDADATTTPAAAHGQPSLPIEAIDALVVDLDAFPTQQGVKPPIAEAPTLRRQRR